MRMIRLVQLGVGMAIIGLSSCKGAAGSYPAPALGVTIDADFQVLDIKKGSAAEQARIQIDDVLLSLNGKTNLMLMNGPRFSVEWKLDKNMR